METTNPKETKKKKLLFSMAFVVVVPFFCVHPFEPEICNIIALPSTDAHSTLNAYMQIQVNKEQHAVLILVFF